MLKIKKIDINQLEKLGFIKDSELSNQLETIYSMSEKYMKTCIYVESNYVYIYETIFNSNAQQIPNAVLILAENDLLEAEYGKE